MKLTLLSLAVALFGAMSLTGPAKTNTVVVGSTIEPVRLRLDVDRAVLSAWINTWRSCEKKSWRRVIRHQQS